MSERCYYCGGPVGDEKVVVSRMGIGLIFCSQKHADMADADGYR